MSSFERLQQAIDREEPVVLATVIRGEPLGQKLLVAEDGQVDGRLEIEDLDRQLTVDAMAFFDRARGEVRTYRTATGDEIDVYFESYLPPRRLVVVGAVHTAIPLVAFAKELGYRTTVIDPRGLFATAERFPHADELIEAWPDEALERLPLGPQTDVVLLAHDPKFEDPALQVALRSRAGYIGAMGSKKTSAERNDRLLQDGFSEEQVDRIHGPIGLNIGARSPAEIAISILAEIIAVRAGRDPRAIDGRAATSPTGATASRDGA